MKLFLAKLNLKNTSLFNLALQDIPKYFNIDVEETELEISVDNAFSADRSQYYSTQIIANTIEASEKLDGKILIITSYDIYVPALTYIFGEAQLNGKHSIVSVCRLHEEFYSGLTNENLLKERTMKEIYHELGHNFGLKHCSNWDCVMHSSPGIEEVDIKGKFYCKKCSNLLPLKKN